MNRVFILLLCHFVFVSPLCAWHSWGSLDTHKKITNDAVLLTMGLSACPADLSSLAYPDLCKYLRDLKTGSDEESHNTTDNPLGNDNKLNGGIPQKWWDNALDENYKKSKYAYAYYNIGRVIHLIQDQAVPAHGANIYHFSSINPNEWDPYGDNLERAVDAPERYTYPSVGVQGGYIYPYEYYQPLLNTTFDQANRSYEESSTWKDPTTQRPYWLTDN